MNNNTRNILEGPKALLLTKEMVDQILETERAINRAKIECRLLDMADSHPAGIDLDIDAINNEISFDIDFNAYPEDLEEDIEDIAHLKKLGLL